MHILVSAAPCLISPDANPEQSPKPIVAGLIGTDGRSPANPTAGEPTVPVLTERALCRGSNPAFRSLRLQAGAIRSGQHRPHRRLSKQQPHHGTLALPSQPSPSVALSLNCAAESF